MGGAYRNKRNVTEADPGQINATPPKIRKRLAIKVFKVRGVTGRKRGK